MAKIRADQLLLQQGLAASRSKAQALIMAGAVFAGDRIVGKPGDSFDEAAELTVKGRGYALRHTWMSSEADASLYMDADLSTDVAVVPEFVRQLDSGADLVVVSRLARSSSTTRSPAAEPKACVTMWRVSPMTKA